MSLTNNQYPDRSKWKDITPYVEYRLNELYSIKSERLTKHNEYKELYKWKRVNPKSPTKSDYKTNAVFSIINTKASEILAATPTYEFVPLDDLAKTNRPIREMFWKYIWMITKSDKELYKVVMDALKYGSWFWYEWLLRDERTHKIPYEQKDWTIEYKEKKVMRYDWVFCEYIPYDKV